MKLGKWWIGWARNVAIGVLWTKDGRIGFAFLGLFAIHYPTKEFLDREYK